MNNETKSLERIEELIKQLLAVQLYQAGTSQQQIAKHLKISTGKCNELLKGVRKGVGQNESSRS